MILGTMFFTSDVGTRKFGWTETHVMKAAETLQAALIDLQALADVRKMLLGAGNAMPYLRVSDPDVDRDSQVVAGPVPAWEIADVGAGPALNPIQVGQGDMGLGLTLFNDGLFRAANSKELKKGVVCDFPQQGVMMRLEATTPFTRRRAYTVRGNPDIVQDTGYDFPNAGSNAVTNRWLEKWVLLKAALINGKYGFRAINTGGGNPTSNVTAISWANGQTTLTIGGNTYAQGDSIQVKNMTVVHVQSGVILRFASGPYTVAVKNGDLITLAGRTPDFTGFIVQKPGKARKLVFEALQYVKAVDRRYGSRETGGPFDRPIGKRKRR